MVEFTLPELGQWLGGWLFPLFRVGGFFLVAPVLGSALVPARIRLGLALASSVLLAPLLPPVAAFDPLSPGTVLLIAGELLLGIALGFVMQLFFQVFVLGAQLVGTQMSLGFASLVDPAHGVGVTVLAQYYTLLLTLVFLAGNGHLAMLEVMIESFRYLPAGAGWLAPEQGWSLVGAGSWLFAGGLLLALPAVTALLVVNLALGVMMRAAPQLNLFSLGFPASMVFGLFVVWLGMREFLPRFDLLSQQAFALLRQLAGAP